MSALSQNSFSLSNLSCSVENGNNGSLVEAVAWWWRLRQRGGSGSEGSLVVTWRWTWPALGWWPQHSGSGGGISAARRQHAAQWWQHENKGLLGK
jgi:hypothetical protein